MTFELLAAAGEAAPQNSFGFMEAMEQGGIIAWSILAVLVIMSVGSFYILFTKLLEQRKVMSQYKAVRTNFWKANSLRDGATKLDKNSAWRQLVDDAILAEDQHAKMTDHQLQACWWPAVPRNGRCNRTVRRTARYGYRYLPRPDQHRHRRFGFDRQGRRPGW